MNDREVAEYLLANPEFFSQHAELLATIRLASPHGKAAVSLQERQMEILREKYKLLERRLAELMRYGHENDSIAAKFSRWSERVIAERDAYALPRAITLGLVEVFDVPQAALRLWDIAEPYRDADFARPVGEEVRLFANGLATPFCGANSGFEAAQWLVGDSAARAGADDEPATSVALLSLRDPQALEKSAKDSADGEPASASSVPTFGLLVMGSPDPRRFHEEMGTDFLTQIATLTSAALSRLLART